MWQETAASIRFCPSPLHPPVHIIGGGPSLKSWLPTLEKELDPACVIAVNDAYQHFPKAAVKVYSDRPWYALHRDELSRLAGDGVVISLCHVSPEKCGGSVGNMLWLERSIRLGLAQPNAQDKVAMNGSTGAAAIHLALAAGATRVVLWGFDMKNDRDTGDGNWHPNPLAVPGTPYRYGVFLKGFEAIAKDLPTEYPHSMVLNAGPDSAIPESVFPHIGPSEGVAL